jgi:hypothetical protein
MSEGASRKKQIYFKMPDIIQECNNNMGRVDFLDKPISLYHVRIKPKKWWWRGFIQMLDAAVVNTWRAQKTTNNEDRVSLMNVRRRQY